MIGALSFALIFAQTPLDRSVASVTYSAVPASQVLAADISARFPAWQAALPDCPCTAKAASADRKNWVGGMTGCPRFYHPGAASGFRSRKRFASAPGTSHGQQCCYDGGGRLLTDGPGAGTPDLWSPRTDFVKHFVYDVQPWWNMGWQEYGKHWVPNPGRDPETGAVCAANEYGIVALSTAKRAAP